MIFQIHIALNTRSRAERSTGHVEPGHNAPLRASAEGGVFVLTKIVGGTPGVGIEHARAADAYVEDMRCTIEAP